MFVLISGISSYLAYGSKLDKSGFKGCCTAVAQRLSKIYGAHLLLFFSAAMFVRLASAYFARVDYVDFLQVKLLFADPRHYMPAALTLSYLPKYLDILPLYLDPARRGAGDYLRRQTRSVARADRHRD